MQYLANYSWFFLCEYFSSNATLDRRPKFYNPPPLNVAWCSLRDFSILCSDGSLLYFDLQHVQLRPIPEYLLHLVSLPRIANRLFHTPSIVANYKSSDTLGMYHLMIIFILFKSIQPLRNRATLQQSLKSNLYSLYSFFAQYTIYLYMLDTRLYTISYNIFIRVRLNIVYLEVLTTYSYDVWSCAMEAIYQKANKRFLMAQGRNRVALAKGYTVNRQRYCALLYTMLPIIMRPDTYLY